MHISQLSGGVLLALLATVTAQPIEGRATCSSYTLLNTRGTSEVQGESAAFKTMNTNIMAKLSGGKIYNTVYPAAWDQNSTAGTDDIINHIKTKLETSPKECFILQGYSQGASATVNALPSLTGASRTAVKGVFLVGDPEHRAGLACNFDSSGGKSTLNVNGLEISYTKGIPAAWVSETMDVCKFGDGVCDTENGDGIDAQHLSYPTDAHVQLMGTNFAVGKLS